MRTIHAVTETSAMTDIKVFGAAFLAFAADWFWWIPDAAKFIILIATCVYVVFRMMREIQKYRRENGTPPINPGDQE